MNITVIHNETGVSYNLVADSWDEKAEYICFWLGIELAGRFPKDKFSFIRDMSNELKLFSGLKELEENQRKMVE